MLKRLELHKFKCYKKHYVDFKHLSVAVGKNNAGKSTMIEALRLIALVFLRYENLSYKSPPEWTGLPMVDKGVSPSLKGIEFSTDNVMYSYEEPPAKIIGVFTNKVKVIIHLGGENKIFANIFDEANKLVTSKRHARNLKVPKIKILPQIGPLQKEENVLTPEYVRANEFTSLMSIHFRNQIHYSSELFEKFKELFEMTWNDIHLHQFLRGNRSSDEKPALLLRDRSFVTEAGKMGHGLQMWLQIIWFLIRCEKDETVILDEPDVYLHADIQRKLIRLLKGKYNQVIIATHSIEIISEVDAENILVVDKNRTKSKYANSLPSVQQIVTEIGSIHNIELIRLWSSGKFLIVEGDSDDIKLLKIFHDKLFPDADLPFDNIPKIYIEGWGGWQRVIGSNQVVSKNSNITTYCILDSDYHTDKAITERYEEAKKFNVNLHIWKRKEIENYLIVPAAVQRLINKGSDKQIQEEDVEKIIGEICDDMKFDVFNCYATEIHNQDRSLSAKTFNEKANEIVEKAWKSKEGLISIIPGKTLISNLSKWSQENYGVSFSKFSLAKEIKTNEIDFEIRDLISKIEHNINFSNAQNNG